MYRKEYLTLGYKEDKMEYVIFGACVISIIIIAKILSWPVKLLWKLIINVLLGGLMLILVNFFGENLGLVIPLNWITSLVAGLLGIPGVILLIVFHYIF